MQESHVTAAFWRECWEVVGDQVAPRHIVYLDSVADQGM